MGGGVVHNMLPVRLYATHMGEFFGPKVAPADFP